VGFTARGAVVDRTTTNGRFVLDLHMRGQSWDADAHASSNFTRSYRFDEDGRYMSPDQMVVAGGEAGYFGYVGGNPIGAVDPSGLDLQPSEQEVEAHNECVLEGDCEPYKSTYPATGLGTGRRPPNPYASRALQLRQQQVAKGDEIVLYIDIPCPADLLGEEASLGCDKEQCKEACERGGDWWEQFCRDYTEEGTWLRGICWSACLGGEGGCKLFCERWCN
jgi:RHS repeat-associated protein